MRREWCQCHNCILMQISANTIDIFIASSHSAARDKAQCCEEIMFEELVGVVSRVTSALGAVRARVRGKWAGWISLIRNIMRIRPRVQVFHAYKIADVTYELRSLGNSTRCRKWRLPWCQRALCAIFLKGSMQRLQLYF